MEPDPLQQGYSRSSLHPRRKYSYIEDSYEARGWPDLFLACSSWYYSRVPSLIAEYFPFPSFSLFCPHRASYNQSLFLVFCVSTLAILRLLFSFSSPKVQGCGRELAIFFSRSATIKCFPPLVWGVVFSIVFRLFVSPRRFESPPILPVSVFFFRQALDSRSRE